VTALIAAPRAGRPQVWIPLLAAALFVALGPIVGPAQFPAFLPRPLTSYIGGATSLSWFPLFPWAAWPLVGVVIGHQGIRRAGNLRRRAVAFWTAGVVGAVVAGAVVLVRHIDPQIVRYPSDFVQQMGPGTFFHQLGLMGPLALLAFVMNHLTSRCRFSVMRQLGRTSLLVYFVHVELCYGLLFRRLHHRLSMESATVGFILMSAAMLLTSVLKTRYWRAGLRGRRTAAP
jgi:fucose 4-O-acetylase-like acetyltransferase